MAKGKEGAGGDKSGSSKGGGKVKQPASTTPKTGAGGKKK